MRKLPIILVALISLIAVNAIAQDGGPTPAAPEPAPAGQPTAASGDETSKAIVGFFEELSTIAEGNMENCAEMGVQLNNYLNENEQLLRDAAYSDSAASAEEEVAIMNAATALGENAGQCYEEPTVTTFFERLVTLTTELDAG